MKKSEEGFECSSKSGRFSIKKTRIVLVFGIFVFLCIFVSGDLEMSFGKNLVVFNISSPFYVEDLVKLNSEIESVSYVEDSVSIGYVNVFGGIGNNFIIYSNKEYEVVLRENVSLILPFSN